MWTKNTCTQKPKTNKQKTITSQRRTQTIYILIISSRERKQTLKQRKSKQTNPPPSAVGFTHSGDEAPIVRR
jgi:hypothetical protein